MNRRPKNLFMRFLFITCFAVGTFLVSTIADEDIDEKTAIEDAKTFLEQNEYIKAAELLKKASEQHPQNLEIAELKVKAYEKADPVLEYRIEAYSNLIQLLKREGAEKLSSVQAELLKDAEEKYEHLMKFRKPVNQQLSKLVIEGEELLDKLIKVNKFVEASYVYQRMLRAGLGKIARDINRKKFGEYDPDALEVPPPYYDDDTETIAKLKRAQKELKKKKYDRAREICDEVLRNNPTSSGARLTMFSVESAAKNDEEAILHALTYLLLPPYLQSSKTIKHIESYLKKKCPQLKSFFKSTDNIVDCIIKSVKRARLIRKDDYIYSVTKLYEITHLTKRIGKLLKDPLMPRGTKILGGKLYDESHWTNTDSARQQLGYLVICKAAGVPFHEFEGFEIKESFELSFSIIFGKEAARGKKTEDFPPGVVFLLFDREGSSKKFQVLFSACSFDNPYVSLHYENEASGETNTFESGFSARMFQPDRLYRIRCTYSHEKDLIEIFVEGKKCASVAVPKTFAIERSGNFCIGQQEYSQIKVRDVYLAP